MERLARLFYRRRWRVVIVWVVGFVAMGALSSAVGTSFANNFSSPGTESQRAFDLLKSRFPAQSGDTATIVFHTPAGINDAGVRARIETLLDGVRSAKHVVDIRSPYEPGSQAISPAGTVG